MIGRGKSVRGDADRLELTALRLPDVERQVSEAVTQADYPAHSELLSDAMTDLAVAQIEAGARPPIDPEASRADRAAIWALERLQRSVDGALLAWTNANDALVRALAYRDLLERPIGSWEWIWTVALAVSVSAVAMLALSGFLAPSIDAYIIGRYVASVLEMEASRFSAEVSLYLAGLTAALIVGGPFLLVIRARGAVSWPVKFMIVFADSLVAAAFAVMRLRGAHVSLQAVSVSLLEVGISLSANAVAFGVGKVLAADLPRVGPYKTAKGRVRTAERAVRDSERDLSARRAELEAAERSLGARDDGARRRPAVRELARATARAAYVVTLAKVVGQAAKARTTDNVSDGIEKYLDTELGREERRGSHAQ